MNLARVVLTVLGTLFVVQGAVQLFQPELLTNLIDISVNSVTGRIELQVIYGGLHMALGAICFWGAVIADNTRAALTAMLFVALGVAVPRVALGLLNQDFSLYSLLAMTVEAASVVLLIWLLKSTRSASLR